MLFAASILFLRSIIRGRRARCAWLLPLMLGLCVFPVRSHAMPDAETTSLEARIVALAESFKGQGDPDRKKQRQIEVLVQELVARNPPAPLVDRMALIVGAWEQIWGPYDYSSGKRGVDRTIDVNHIYQVVSAGGYYHNINPSAATGDAVPKRVGVLRGVYEIDPSRPDVLNVRFTRFTQVPGFRGKAEDYVALAVRSESGILPNERGLVPTWVVKTFFGKGSLREVYTSADLRITFGSDRDNLDDNYIYVLQRVDRAVSVQP
jgi:hypothetical protein